MRLQKVSRSSSLMHFPPFIPILPRHVTLNRSYVISRVFVGSDLHRASGHTVTQSFPQWVRVSTDSRRMRECICHSAFRRSAPFPSALIPFSLSLVHWVPGSHTIS